MMLDFQSIRQDADTRLRVLVVDDEPDLCVLLSTAMQSTGGVTVEVAHDAVGALQALSEEDDVFDAILLDIQMPRTTGTELCAIIRSTPGYEDVPIIMLTAMAERRFLHAAYANGADDYITKPFDFDEIRSKLSRERWMRKRRVHLKAGRASFEAGSANSGREVINALEDPVHLPSIARCIRRDAFQNYLLQARCRPGRQMFLRAIKVAGIHDIFSELSTAEYQSLMDRIAHVVSDATEQSDDVVTHLGNGILLTASDGRSALTKDTLDVALAAAGVAEGLKARRLELRVIVGDEFLIGDDENADVLFMVSRAIEGAEHQEENLSGWATFREWLSFRKSTGRERARVDQSAYEQILGDFIAAGELSWK
jgi:CheY-like chemotaxis protein